MGLWSGGCDEEEKEFYYQKINSETNYHKNEHETSFTNESLQVGNIAFEKIELEKENAELKMTVKNLEFANEEARKTIERLNGEVLQFKKICCDSCL